MSFGVSTKALSTFPALPNTSPLVTVAAAALVKQGEIQRSHSICRKLQEQNQERELRIT